jgi:hypothetical protein
MIFRSKIAAHPGRRHIAQIREALIRAAARVVDDMASQLRPGG